MKRSGPLLALFFSAPTLFAQSDSGDAGALAGVGLMCGCYLIVGLLAIALYVFIAIWTSRDAKSRNSPNAQLVRTLVWIPPTSMVGLVIHLATRPQGNLVTCPSCNQKRLAGSATCPHCGAA